MTVEETGDMLRAPFPWFGGKSRAADLIWSRFGDVQNYVEPFAGSLAVLLQRPHKPHVETVNDLDCYVANFWRAVKADPDGVAVVADWPVNEADILARHEWLLSRGDFRQRIRTDPDYYDVTIAGRWVWGVCCWIGSGWCRQSRDGHSPEQLPHLGNPGMGIHRSKLPHLGDPGRGAAISDWMSRLALRLRAVRVACGEWDRVLSPAVTERHGPTGVLLDPPYSEYLHGQEYSAQSDRDVSSDVRRWAIENGDNPLLSIALCSYEGEHEMPSNWSCVPWRARKGYQTVADDGSHSGHNERIWFSPHCLDARQPKLDLGIL